MQLYRDANYKRAIVNFKESLNGVQYLMVKGSVIASLYQIPELRTMGDIDVLIHKADRVQVHNCLTNSGFQFQNQSEGTWVYDKSGYIFEVHDSLIHRREELNYLIEYFSSVWDYVETDVLDWSFHLIFLLEHLRHHFVGCGVGFRQFMDIAIICKKCGIKWSFVEKELNKLNLFNFAATIFAFNKRWFGIGAPIERKNLSEEFYLAATQKIFEDGVFGFNNKENEYSSIAIQAHYSDIDKRTAKRRFVFKKLFPSYEAMCRLPYCTYVRKSKILLPIAWIQRIIYRAFSRNSRNYMKNQLNDDKVSARIDMLRQWGL